MSVAVPTAARPPAGAAPASPRVFGTRDLTVRFGRRTALDHVSLEVPRGSVTAVVGGDGSGKTTLLRTIARLARPDEGVVHSPPRECLGFVSSGSAVYRDLTVAESIAFAARAYDMPEAALVARRDTLLKRTGLAGFEQRLAGRLSGGMRQKLAVLLALLHEPELLVMDEPTTGIDPVSRAELWRLFAAAAAEGAALVLATAYIDEAERAARVCVLHRGRQLLTGTPDEVLDTVRGAMWTAPFGVGSPGTASAWRSGERWRAYSPSGPPPGLPAALPAVPELADAVIVATLSETDGSDLQDARTPADAHTSRAAAPHTATLRAPSAPLIQGRGLVRRFGSFCAVDHADLDVHPGEVVGLLGANGAGKTTLIRMALGLLPPTDGAMLLFGVPPSRETRRRIGYVPQGLGLWEDLTVTENLLFAAGAFGNQATLSDADLVSAESTLIRDLPLGLRRRLAFVAALAHEPELLVLDEPTSGVDPLARARLWDTVHSAVESGAGALITTHYMDEAAQCDRLVIMAEGHVVAAGTSEELLRGRSAVEVAADDWPAAFAALTAAGLPVALMGRRLRVPGATTDDVGAVLTRDGVEAALDERPASLEEVFVTLAQQSLATTGATTDGDG